jgi:SAM-dependent methyltransferase
MKRAQWNRLANDFETEVCDITREESSDSIARYVNAAKIPARDSVLVDLGCGLGTFVSKFGARFGRAIAIDHAGKIVARARAASKCASPVTWVVLDVAKAGAVLGPCADLTVCMNVITSSDKERRDALWQSVATVTKPKGYALVVVPSIESDAIVQTVAIRAGRAAEFVSTPGGLVHRDGMVQKHFSRPELAESLVAFGFTVIRIGRAFYPWSVEGLRKPANARLPWDWMCLARRTSGRCESARPSAR